MRPLPPYRRFLGIGIPGVNPAQRERLAQFAPVELLDAEIQGGRVPHIQYLLRFIADPREEFRLDGKASEDRRRQVELVRRAQAEGDTVGPAVVIRVRTRAGVEFLDIRPWRDGVAAIAPAGAQLDQLA